MIINNKQLNFTLSAEQMLSDIDRDKKNISAFSLQFGERVILAKEAFDRVGGAGVYVCEDYVMASRAFEQFSCLSDKVILITAKDDVLGYRKIRSNENNIQRTEAMGKFCSNDNCIIVTSVAAMCQLFPNKDDFKNAIIEFEVGGVYDQDQIVSSLVAAGYRRESQVDGTAQFSVRGDIVDIYSSTYGEGVRLEFFGDECESIKLFDISTQKADSEKQSITIMPVTEIFYSENDADAILKTVLNDMVEAKDEYADTVISLQSDLSLSLSSNCRDMSLSFIMPLLPHSSFREFFSPSVVIYDDVKRVVDNMNMVYTEHENRYKADLVRGDVLRSSIKQLVSKDAALNFVDADDGKATNEKVANEKAATIKSNARRVCQLAYHSTDSQNRIFSPESLYKFNSMLVSDYTRSTPSLIRDLCAWISTGYRVVVFCGKKKVQEHLKDTFVNSKGEEYNYLSQVELSSDKLTYGAIFQNEKVVLIGTSNIVTHTNKPVIRRGKKDVFVQPTVGTYVVHNTHGIGFFEGIERIAAVKGVSERDYAIISYRDGDKLYVPIENIDSVSSYGETNSDSPPKLNKMGGKDFARIKERVKASVNELAVNLIELYAKREAATGYKYDKDMAMYDEFCSCFPYTETADQLSASQDCIKDLTTGKVMDRLLCGDVGYGKTEVALRAAYKVISEGKQVAFLSPTTILASQHHLTVKKRMDEFAVRSASLTRFNTAHETNDILKELQSGVVDIICGTHRLLSKDVIFKDLGLLVLDEEQRFGVADKEKIKELRSDINVLTLSATPIPRTLHMSMSGIRDISVLDTPPYDRIPIKTYVTELTDSLIFDAVTREVNRGGQVFIVYNAVASIESFTSKVRAIVGDGIRVKFAHGQMGASSLEETIYSFTKGEFDVLVASTIIENGIDMPNANTIIVCNADKFGLSQLYQLRGRVGRSNRLAYAYFTYATGKMLSQNAFKRLDAITQFTDFGSGFKIAMRDLEIRGAGNVLGKQQHGHIEKVGYDLYYKILSSAVAALRGEESEMAQEVRVSTDFNAFIPENYVSDSNWRMRVYSRISQIDTLNAKKQLGIELEEVYGQIPSSVANLMFVSLIKNLAQKLNAKSVAIGKKQCSVTFEKSSQIPFSEFGKVNIGLGRVEFGSKRADLVKFLLTANKKSS